MHDDMTKRQVHAAFLDNLEQADRLRKWHAFCAQMPFADEPDGEPNGSTGSTWADVIFGPVETPAGDADAAARITRRIDDLGRRGNHPDGALPPLQAFLLVFLHWMETPTRLYNGLMARHRDLYYRGELGLSERGMGLDEPGAGPVDTVDRSGAPSLFSRRAAHRLHHRNRILTTADMYAFVQDTFPQVRAMKLVKVENCPCTYRLVVVRGQAQDGAPKKSPMADGDAGQLEQNSQEILSSMSQTIRRHCSPWLVLSVEEAEPVFRNIRAVIRRARANHGGALESAALESSDQAARSGTPATVVTDAVDKAIARDVEIGYGQWTVAQDGRTLLLGQELDRYRLAALLLGNPHVDELVSLHLGSSVSPKEYQYVVPRVTVSQYDPASGEKDA